MKKLVGVLGFLALVTAVAPVFAEHDPGPLRPLRDTQLLALKPKRDAIETLQLAAQAGYITVQQAQMASAPYLKEAAEIAMRPVLVEDLFSYKYPTITQAEPTKLTLLQRAAGFVTLVNVFWVLAIILVVGAVTVLFGSFVVDLLKLLKEVPLVVYEFMFYAAGIGLAMYGRTLRPEVAPYVGLTGCLLFGGALWFTAKMRKLFDDKFNFSAFLFVAWTIAALAYQSQMLGFIAIAALLGALGFSIIVTPLCYGFGFHDNVAVGRATSAAFLLLGAFVGLRVAGKTVPRLQAFEFGALFIGSFVGYLGLLIASSRWYDGKRTNYAVFQVLTILAGVAALAVGSIFGIGELQKIGGTFFVLYAIEKLFEIPAKSVRGYAAIALLVGGMLYALSYFLKTNPEAWRPYFLMWS